MKHKKTWNGNEQVEISQILNNFETNLSCSPSSQSVISPLLQPTAQQAFKLKGQLPSREEVKVVKA